MAKIKMNVSVTVAETFKDFLITKRAKGLAEKTLASYEQHFSAISKHLDVNVPVEQLDKAALDAMIVSMRGADLAANSIQSYTRALKSYFSWCNTEGLINLNMEQYNTIMLQIKEKQPERKAPAHVICLNRSNYLFPKR